MMTHDDVIRPVLVTANTPLTVHVNYCQQASNRKESRLTSVVLVCEWVVTQFDCDRRWTSSCTSCRPEPPAHWSTTASRRKSLVCECQKVHQKYTLYMLPIKESETLCPGYREAGINQHLFRSAYVTTARLQSEHNRNPGLISQRKHRQSEGWKWCFDFFCNYIFVPYIPLPIFKVAFSRL